MRCMQAANTRRVVAVAPARVSVCSTAAAGRRGAHGSARSAKRVQASPAATSALAAQPAAARGSAQRVHALPAATSSTAAAPELAYETDPAGRTRVKYAPEGWKYWQWRGEHRIHYIEAGAGNAAAKDRPTCLLVHGYGASAYHWRYMIPALEAAGYRVFTMCLLGFGYSDKALGVEYGAGALWADQIADFVQEVVGVGSGGSGGSGGSKVVIAGNSLGAYAAMVAAARRPELFAGLALLNAAGPVSDASAAATAAAADEADISDEDLWPLAAPPAPWWRPLADAAKRAVLFFAFQRAKQPQRIREVLEMVYSSSDTVDDDLVESIRAPAADPAAAEVFFRLQTPGPGAPPPPPVDRLMRRIRARRVPTLLLWGAGDVWIKVSRAELLQAANPDAKLVVLANAGHCPHDDAPEEASAAMIEFVGSLPPAAAA